MTLVDSSGWIEYFTDGALADRFASYLENIADVTTPTIVIFEVFRDALESRYFVSGVCPNRRTTSSHSSRPGSSLRRVQTRMPTISKGMGPFSPSRKIKVLKAF